MAVEDPVTQTLLECNPAFAGLLGYAREDLMGVPMARLLGPGEAGAEQATPGEPGRVSREACLHCKDGTLLRVRLDISAGSEEPGSVRVITLHELSDSARLAAAERRVAELEAQLQGVLDTVPVGLAIAEDASGRHILGNSFLELMLGLPRGAEISKTAEPERGYRVVRDGSPVSAEELPVQRACRGERVEGEQLEVVCENGHRLFLLANAAPLHDAAGAVSGAVGAFLDVTQRVVAERRLAEQHLHLEEQVAERTRELEQALADSARSRERFELAMRGANDGLWDWDMLTGEVYYSPRWKAMLGYGDDELEPCFHTWARLVDADGRQRALDRVEEIKSGRSDHFEIEFRMRHKQGHDVYVRSRAFVARRLDGRPVRMVGTACDITEQKRREQALRESELKFAKAFHCSPMGMSISRMEDGRFLDINDRFLSIFGYERAQVIGHTSLQLGLWEDPLQRRRIVAELRGTGRAHNFEVAFHRPNDSSQRTVLASFERLDLGGETCLLGTVLDITERKALEQALRRESHKNEALLRNASDGIFLMDKDARLVGVSDSTCAMLGYTREELIGMHLSQWDAEYDGELLSFFHACLANPARLQFERRHRRKGGDILDVEISAVPVEIDGEHLLFCSSRDISQRKRDEAALIEREARFRRQSRHLEEVIWGTNIGTWEWNVQTGATEFNGRWAEICGYTLEELQPVSIATWNRLAHPDDLKRSEKLLESCFLRQTDYYECEARMRHKGGHWVWVLDRGRVVEWTTDGRPLRMSGTHQDITERKRAEDALMRKTRELRALLDTIPAPVFFKDLDMRHVTVNQAFCEFVGLSADCIVGRSNRELVSEKLARSFDLGDRAVLQEGVAILGDEMEIPDAWGRKGWYSVYKSPLFGEDGQIVGLVGLRVDITQRKQGEAMRISSLERQRDTLIREVHHRIKNHLQGVIGLLRSHTTRNPETIALIEAAVSQVHAISQVYGLQGRAAGGVLALRRFLEDMVTQRPARLPVELSVADDFTDAILSRESLVPLALIINELLTNAEKHMLPSQQPQARVRLESGDGRAVLRIFGSPARLPDQFDFQRGRGIGAGLDLVRSLLPEGVTLSFREEAGGVVAELVLTASALMPPKAEG